MNCPQCNKLLKDNAKFCPYCGLSMDAEPTVSVKNEGDYFFAEPQKAPPAAPKYPQPAPAPQPKKKAPKKQDSSKIAISVLSLVLSLFIAGGAVTFILYKKNSKNDDSSDPAQVTSIVRGRVDTDTVRYSEDEGLELEVYSYDIDRETGRVTVSDEPVEKVSVNSNGEYELELPPGDYVIQSQGDKKATDDDDVEINPTPIYQKNITVPKGDGDEMIIIDDNENSDSGDNSDDHSANRTAGFETGYKNGESVDFNGVVYYADKNGLFLLNDNGGRELDAHSCNSLATNGEYIYYSVLSETVPYDEGETVDENRLFNAVSGKYYYDIEEEPVEEETDGDEDIGEVPADEYPETDEGIEEETAYVTDAEPEEETYSEDIDTVYNYDSEEETEVEESVSYNRCDVYRVKANGKNSEYLFPANSEATPICEYGNKLYYTDTDYSEADSFESACPSLYSYDLETGDTDLLVENAGTTQLYSNIIFIRPKTNDVSNAPLQRYNIKTGKLTTTKCKATSFYIEDDNLYFYKNVLKDGEEYHCMYSRDLTDFKNSKSVLLVELENNGDVLYANHKYAYFQYTEYKNEIRTTYYFRRNIKKEKNTKIELENSSKDDIYKVYPYMGGVLFINNSDGTMYYLDDSAEEVEVCGAEYEDEIFLLIVNNKVYTLKQNEDGTAKISRYEFTPPESLDFSDDDDSIDYAEYLGTWSEGTDDESKSVHITALNDRRAEFTIVSETKSEFASADIKKGKVDEDCIDFDYTDNNGNKGSGSLTLNGDTVDLSVSCDEKEDEDTFVIDGDGELTRKGFEDE